MPMTVSLISECAYPKIFSHGILALLPMILHAFVAVI